MKHFMKLLMLLTFTGFFLAACEDKGPFEEAGEQMDEGVEEMKDEWDDATTN